MTATNHALTGAVIGLAIGNPWLAIPAAFVSHFVVDAIPHFGMNQSEAKWLGSKRFLYLLAADAAICVSLVFFLYYSGHSHWLLAAVCAFVAAAPDFMWVGKFFSAQAGKAVRRPKYLLARIHSKVQWFQKPIGLVVEVAWAFLCVILLVDLLAAH